jgi:uncharacterized protein YcaQ
VSPRRRDTLGAPEARRVAIAAAGLAAARPARPGPAHAGRLLDRLGAVQIDSVVVLARAHELALWSRLGPHPRGLLPRLEAAGRATELWAHEASVVPVGLHPLLRWRMARPHPWAGMARFARERPERLDAVEREVAARGPLTAADLGGGARRGPWWGWDEAKRALELLFWQGRVAVRRRPDFTRLYDLPERVLPPEVLAAPTPAAPDAQRELLAIAAAAQGVATAADLIDHFRLPAREARPRLAELVEEGRLLAVRVRGWEEPAYLHPGARVPRRTSAAALVSPFDALVWHRPRVQRLFGIRFRIEIYVPAARRVHGYYVLPFVLGDRIAARVDLKADRAAGILRVRAAHAEEGEDPGAVAPALVTELRALAGWLGLGDVEPAPAGDLAPALADALRRA